MLRTLIVVLAAAALNIAPAAQQDAPRADARPSWEFEPLPGVVDGVRLSNPIAIANDGAVLVWVPSRGGSPHYGVYRNGRLDAFEVAPETTADWPIWTLMDINVRHEVVGNNWFVRFPYSGYVGWGFIRDPRSHFERIVTSVESSGVNSINDRGVAAGFLIDCTPERCACPIGWGCGPTEIYTAMIVVDGQAVPLAIPGSGPLDSTSAVAIDDAGRILGWGAPGGAPWLKTWFLLDGERIETISLPDVPDPSWLELLDLNNRGQILGRWQDTQAGVTQSFLREPDGTIEPIEWTHSWPVTMEVQLVSGDGMTMHLIATGTSAHRFNDSGSVLASAQALYEGRQANGLPYRQIEYVHGIGRKGGRP